jgi:hypothetical protein
MHATISINLCKVNTTATMIAFKCVLARVDLDPQQQAQFKRQLLKPGLVALSMDSVVLYTLYILLIDWSGHTPESTNDLVSSLRKFAHSFFSMCIFSFRH